MFKRNYVISISLCVALTNAFAAQWDEIESAEAQGRFSGLHVYIDKGTIVRDGDLASAWYRFTQSGGSGQQYNSTFDCKRRVSKTNEAFFLQPDGSRSKYGIPFSADFTAIPPETVSSVVLKALCSRKWYEVWKP